MHVDPPSRAAPDAPADAAAEPAAAPAKPPAAPVRGTPGGRMAVAASIGASGPADEPRLPAGKDMDGHPFEGLHYQPYRGDLVVGGISGSDVGQGDLGDCYFLSSLVALANNHPEAVRDAIKANGDGTYTVTFQDRKGGTSTPVPVRVDAQFPTDASGAQKFGKGLESGPDGQELWPALYEKAYATWKQGYVHINQGGDGGTALGELTGKPSETVTPDKLSADELWQKLTAAQAAKDPMVSSTPLTRELEKRAGKDQDGLIEGHYYAVAGVSERDGQRYVKLYTPLVDFTSAPVSTPSAADDAQRWIELPLATYQRDFDSLAINKMSG
jgi:hypothetical protein